MTSPAPGVQLNSDGTPALTAPSSAVSGAVDIWNLYLPASLQTTGTSAPSIWFGTSKKTTPAGPATTQNLGPGMRDISAPTPATTTTQSAMSTPSEILSQYAAMSWNDPASYLTLQQQLASGPWGTVKLNGNFDSDTREALTKALEQYVQLTQGSGVAVSFTDFLDTSSKSAAALKAATASPKYTSVQQNDPATIMAAAQSAAVSALGQGLTQDQLNKFVAQFQASQVAGQTGTAGTVETEPDLSSDAMQFAQQQNPGAYQQNQRQAYLNTMVNMFAPSGSQRPDMTPTPSV